jgi:3'(2'), 5'-bisphosphate nucleotidase
MTRPYEWERVQAITAVTNAAKLCEQVRANRCPDAIQKQDSSPVTIADFGAQAIICRALHAAFPNDSIVGEEDAAMLRQPDMVDQLAQVTDQVQTILPDATPSSVTTWIDYGNGNLADRYWTLDPIDGTTGFLRGDQYAIALALIEGGEVKVGVMGCPAFPLSFDQPEGEQGVLFVAVRGQGSSLICLKSGETRPIQVQPDATSVTYRLAESMEAAHGDRDLQWVIADALGLKLPPLQMDSQAKYGAVASGQAALYLRLPWSRIPEYKENIWDHAAGAIVIEEAGGRVTDAMGKPLDFMTSAKMIHNRGIVASNGVLHDQVLALLQEEMPAS